MNKSPITKAQNTALKMVDVLCKRLNEPHRKFTQSELLGIKLLTMNPLVDKGYLGRKTVNGVVYYRLLKERVTKGRNVSYIDIVDTNKIVLNADDVFVTIEYPRNMTQDTAILVAKEVVYDECNSEDERSSHGE